MSQETLAFDTGLTPATALTAADPYPYYAKLVADRPAYFDHDLNAFVIAGAELTTAALADPALRVRPADQPVPAGIVGTPAGEVFGQLVRMTDGSRQQQLKRAVITALDRLDPARITAVTTERAHALLAAGGSVTELMFRLPAQVVATLCGLTEGQSDEAARLIGDFVLCLPATASAADLSRAAAAADRLQSLLGPALIENGPSLLGDLVRAAGRPDGLLANAIGFLSQTYDATAGLIGNTLVNLTRHDPGADRIAFVREVARFDSPVHTTRRFAVAGTSIGDLPVAGGQSVLLLLGAANRDPAANPQPDRFQPDRDPLTMFTFGAGGHACPGAVLAIGITAAAVETALGHGLDPAALALAGYRPSGNIRCPRFAGADEKILGATS